MKIQTTSGNFYSYLRRTNEIVPGIVDDEEYIWKFEPLHEFSSLPNVDTIIISITEQCNLRCTYCCYSGKYLNNRVHSPLSLKEDSIDAIYDFVESNTDKRPLRFSFYGGEPLTHYTLIQYAVVEAETRWRDQVLFSITTNATLLTPEQIDWLAEHHVELCISIDGTAAFHDNQRVGKNGQGTYARIRKNISYIKDKQADYLRQTSLMMTRQSFDDLELLAEAWNNDDIFHDLPPSNISSLAPNFAEGVDRADFDKLKARYLLILSAYQDHPEWIILKKFLKECIDTWKNRPIMEAEGEMPMATCLPVSNKLYFDTKLQIGICEKSSDNYRIGSIQEGINWQKANEYVLTYYKSRKERCKSCPAIRMCNLCLASIEFNEGQWDILCHNEQTFNKLYFWLFCEMAERGLLDNDEFPTLEINGILLDKLSDTDIPQLMEIFADEETKKYLPELSEAVREKEDMRSFLQNSTMAQTSGETGLWGIRQNFALIGLIGIIDIPNLPSMFYAMNPHHRGQGIMTKCVAEVVHWFLINYPELTLHTEVDKNNIPSIHLLQKNDFTQSNENEQKIFMKVVPTK